MDHSKNTNSAQPEVKSLQNSSVFLRCPHDRENPYAQTSRDLIRTQDISPECIWLLIYLLSHKDGWRINVRQICEHVKGRMGRDKVFALINEAIEFGYMKRDKIKDGNLLRYVYYVSESPVFLKKCFRYPDFQDTENQDTASIYIKKEHVEEQQQQQSAREPSKKSAVPAAAVSHSEKKERPRKKEDIPKPPPKPKVEPYECLKSLDMPDVDKVHITETYTESVVLHAVDWAMHPLTTLRKELAAAIKWACKTKPALPKESKSKEDKKRDDDVSRDNLIFQNRSYAQHLHTTLAKKIPSNRFFRIYATHVELGCKKKLPSNGIETSTSLMPIGFAEPDFVIQVENQLRELGIDGTNTEYSKDAQKHP